MGGTALCSKGWPLSALQQLLANQPGWRFAMTARTGRLGTICGSRITKPVRSPA